ncbi:OstA-like protein [Flavobacterium aciduliphilum]|uniref:OstA-like protein n=1 Tax=Flavobacterium aciduliphilum TaxID=1101402 RepID=UPI0037440C65
MEHSDFSDINQTELPNALLLTGNVRVTHDGIVMTCNKAYYFQDENYIKAFGEVQMVQGDTLFLNSKYAEYNGNIKKAFASGNVVMNSPESTMTTDTLYFDRNSQEAYFNSKGNIVNKTNTLTSNSGRYYVKERKYQFLNSVVLNNPEYTIKSNHLDYYTKQGDSYLYGPSTITGKDNFIYTENGYYNSKKNIGNFKKKSYIKYKDRLIEGDSLYYDRKTEYASGTNNVKITDSINKAIIRGHYGEVFKNKDSLYVTKHASIRYLVEKDSMFIHAKKIIVTGKTGERIVRGFHNVRFYKTELSGKCDSIHSDQKKALTKLIGQPILWNFENQLTGDLMHLIGNNKTEKLDSLKVFNNSFIISKDTVGSGFNQIKGINLYGKFLENRLHEANIVKNVEVIYYMRNNKKELIGINKKISSKVNMVMDDKSKIETVTFFDMIDGDIYPEQDLPENARKLKGFNWRGAERIKNKEEIFPPEEVEMDQKIVEESKRKYQEEQLNQSVQNNKLEDHINGDDFYEKIFIKYNNRIIEDKNGTKLLVKNFKFRFAVDENTFNIYKKSHPLFKNEIKINQIVWFKKMQYGKYDGGFFKGTEPLETIELSKKEKLTYDEIFSLYNDRVIIDRNGMELLVKNGKFKFPTDFDSLKKLKANNPKYRNVVRINQVLWDWNSMQYGKYDGGLFTGNEKE